MSRLERLAESDMLSRIIPSHVMPLPTHVPMSMKKVAWKLKDDACRKIEAIFSVKTVGQEGGRPDAATIKRTDDGAGKISI